MVVVVDGDKWAGSGYILIVEPTGFANMLIMRNARKKAVKNNLRFFGLSNYTGRMVFSSTEVERLRIVCVCGHCYDQELLRAF